MGACMSAPPSVDVTEQDKILHREAEKQLKEAKAKMATQVKVLLLGSGDSGKSTVLKQMRLIHKLPFQPHEIEHYRQLVFDNLTRGLRYVLDAMEDLDLEVLPENFEHLALIDGNRDIRDGEPFPVAFSEPLKALWRDPNVQSTITRGNEALPDNLFYFFSDMDRLFDPHYQPTEQDIIRCRARTTGITQTTFHLREHEMIMVDVGGQKSERRKWIHCFQDVTSILFLVSLNGYDQCLVEDKDANQMQDAMTIWDSICHSQWFKQTSIILFLNKNDLFQEKVPNSDIKNFFPDYTGTPDQKYHALTTWRLGHVGGRVPAQKNTAKITVLPRSLLVIRSPDSGAHIESKPRLALHRIPILSQSPPPHYFGSITQHIEPRTMAQEPHSWIFTYLCMMKADERTEPFGRFFSASGGEGTSPEQPFSGREGPVSNGQQFSHLVRIVGMALSIYHPHQTSIYHPSWHWPTLGSSFGTSISSFFDFINFHLRYGVDAFPDPTGAYGMDGGGATRMSEGCRSRLQSD
ncbi:hypothetical protein D9619_003664 [Psilocybe cf. subviscida]|uniref:Guanine nucleotide-binding protein alpha-2 subunit n=1 Tax=Psilocybe cf. subviscida TaxID=2480587 RepID=A0A8H5AWU1_9AGAR|nr:hypothetical protein D9619_003664 [Psilocybe cf. subviscida]